MCCGKSGASFSHSSLLALFLSFYEHFAWQIISFDFGTSTIQLCLQWFGFFFFRSFYLHHVVDSYLVIRARTKNTNSEVLWYELILIVILILILHIPLTSWVRLLPSTHKNNISHCEMVIWEELQFFPDDRHWCSRTESTHDDKEILLDDVCLNCSAAAAFNDDDIMHVHFRITMNEPTLTKTEIIINRLAYMKCYVMFGKF